MNNESLRDELYNEKLRGVYAFIDASHDSLSQKVDSNQELIMEKLSAILAQTTKTNGRVNKLEEDYESYKKSMEFFSFVIKYKKVAALAFVGFVVLLLFLGLESTLKLF